MCVLSVRVYEIYWVVGGLSGIQKLTKKIHHNFGITGESYTGYDSHSRLETTRMRLIWHPYKKNLIGSCTWVFLLIRSSKSIIPSNIKL